MHVKSLWCGWVNNIRLRRSKRRRTTHSHPSAIEPLECRQLLTTDFAHEFHTVYKPGVDPSVIQELEDAIHVESVVSSVQKGEPWPLSGAAEAVTELTWGVAQDGTQIFGFNDEPTSPSDLIAFLDGIYGSAEGPVENRPWFPILQRAIDSWAAASGVRLTYEPADDGKPLVFADGEPGVRPDIRLAGHPIDGNRMTLAYAFFPNAGDIVLDTSDDFFLNTDRNSRNLANVLQHEVGRALGLEHVYPVDGTKIMEPILVTSVDGLQPDDILAIQRAYGDPDEPNNSFDTATSVAAHENGTFAVGTRSINGPDDVDYFEFTVTTDAVLNISVAPEGTAYLRGTEAGSVRPFNAKTQAELALNVVASDRTTLVASAHRVPAGQPASLRDIPLAAGTYFISVSTDGDGTQLYGLEVDIDGRVADPPDPGLMDLAVTSVSIVEDRAYDIAYEVRVRNAGSAAVDLADIAIQAYVSSDGTSFDRSAGGRTLGQGLLLPGHSVALQFGADLAFDPVAFPHLLVQVDSDQILSEDSETNNILSTHVPENQLGPRFVVNTLDDTIDINPGDGRAGDINGYTSLRSAVMEASATAGPALIVLPEGTYELTIPPGGAPYDVNGDLNIDDSVTIVGAGRNRTTISGGNRTRVFWVDLNRRLSLDSLTISNGWISHDGGGAAIRSEFGKVRLNNVSLVDNEVSRGRGGAVYQNGGIFDILNSTIASNHADLSFAGGLYLINGDMTIVNSVVADNTAAYGSGISNFGSLTVTDSVITRNAAFSNAGGISNEGDLTIVGSEISFNTGVYGGGVGGNGTAFVDSTEIVWNDALSSGGGWRQTGRNAVTFVRSLFEGNSAGEGGAVVQYSTSPMVFSESRVRENFASGVGGGLYVRGVVTLDNSTVDGNSAGSSAGGILAAGAAELTLHNTTLSGNTADVEAGGLLAMDTAAVQVTHGTITGNRVQRNGPDDAAGIKTRESATVAVVGTILAGNGTSDILGRFESGGFNVVGIAGSGIGFNDGINGDQVGTSVIPVEPRLGPLKDNGGHTPTHAPLPGSPVIDAGSNAEAPLFDQIGTRRPLDGDGDGVATADIGTVEFLPPAFAGGVEAPHLPSISLSNTIGHEGQAGTRPVRFLVSLSEPSPHAVSLNVSTADGTARVSDGDYLPLHDHPVTFRPGETVRLVEVRVVGDRRVEGTEWFSLVASDAVNGAISDGTGEGRITDGDGGVFSTRVEYVNPYHAPGEVPIYLVGSGLFGIWETIVFYQSGAISVPFVPTSDNEASFNAPVAGFSPNNPVLLLGSQGAAAVVPDSLTSVGQSAWIGAGGNFVLVENGGSLQDSGQGRLYYVSYGATLHLGDATGKTVLVENGGSVYFDSGSPTVYQEAGASVFGPGVATVIHLPKVQVNLAEPLGNTPPGANSAPIPTSDLYLVTTDQTLVVDGAGGLLHNDFDQDGDPLTAVLVSEPLFGQVLLNPDGAFSYLPDPGFEGFAQFVYAASDGQADSEHVTVDLVVSSGGSEYVPYPALSAEVVVAQTDGGTTVTESGTSDTLHVRLNSTPAADVLVEASAGGSRELSVAPGTLVFTPDNWDQFQTVTITGLDDRAADGDRRTAVTIRVVDASSDPLFLDAATQTVAVVNVDDDPVNSLPAGMRWIDVMTGDVNGDGIDDLVGRDESSGEWWVGLYNGSAYTYQQWGRWASIMWLDVSLADVNGDGLADVIGRQASNGNWWVGLSDGDRFNNQRWGRWAAIAWLDVGVADVNGDKLADIVARQASNGNWWVALSDGDEFVNQHWGHWAPIGWIDINIGDVNGDGNSDVVGRQQSNGNWWVALSDGISFHNENWGHWSNVGWVDVNVADINGDGRMDVIGRQAGNGNWWAGLSDGTGFTNQRWGFWTPIAWADVSVIDVNGDRIQDIVGRQQSNGRWWAAISDGRSLTNVELGYWDPSVTWLDVRAGDFNNDGIADIAGRNSATGDWHVGRPTARGLVSSKWEKWDPWGDASVIDDLLTV